MTLDSRDSVERFPATLNASRPRFPENPLLPLEYDSAWVGRDGARAQILAMRFELAISEEALAQLRSLPKEWRQRIGQKLDVLQSGLQGDVKKLAGQAGKYRLRVGSHRVLFTLEKNVIVVYLVKDRKNAYRD